MSASTPHSTPYYYVPAQSSHPVMAAAGLFFVILGASQWINGIGWGAYALGFGLLWWLVVLFQWFRDAARESEGVDQEPPRRRGISRSSPGAGWSNAPSPGSGAGGA